MEEALIEKREIGDPLSAMLFIFALITILYWASFAGVFKGKAELVVGLIQLACFPGYTIGATLFYLKGDTVSGTIFMIFATMFAGVGGVANIATHFSNINGWGLDGTVTALPYLFSGIILIPFCAMMRKVPIIQLLMFVDATIFLIIFPLVVLGFLPATLFVVLKWMLLFLGVTVIYSSV
jgi:hypothetical protein